MRILAALLLIGAGSLFTYWAFLETIVSGRGAELEWAFVTAFGWLICHDVWQRFFGRAEQPRSRPHRTEAARPGRTRAWKPGASRAASP
jgi:hypothetical protein